MSEGNKVVDLKLEAARAQLGTALHLYLLDKDPISVHVLASGAGEIVDGLVGATGLEPFSAHILSVNVDLKVGDLRRLRSQYWNAIKHFRDHSGRIARDDAELLSDFDDAANDIQLFIGWWDYARMTSKLPLEAQAFQAWWFTLNPEKIHSGFDKSGFDAMFPGLRHQHRVEQKRRLRRAIETYKKNKTIMNDPRTERRPLCLPRVPRV